MDNRAVSPVVGKLLASGLAVLFVASVVGLLVGGVSPEYRTATGEELGERVLATAASHVEQADPAVGGDATVRVAADLPGTIRGQQYRVRVDNGTLALDHPDDAIDARAPLSLPGNLTVVDGSWHSGDAFVVLVTGSPGNRTLALGGRR